MTLKIAFQLLNLAKIIRTYFSASSSFSVCRKMNILSVILPSSELRNHDSPFEWNLQCWLKKMELLKDR